jgi:hypothetical protein
MATKKFQSPNKANFFCFFQNDSIGLHPFLTIEKFQLPSTMGCVTWQLKKFNHNSINGHYLLKFMLPKFFSQQERGVCHMFLENFIIRFPKTYEMPPSMVTKNFSVLTTLATENFGCHKVL